MTTYIAIIRGHGGKIGTVPGNDTVIYEKIRNKNLAPLFLYHFLFVKILWTVVCLKNGHIRQIAVISLSAPGGALLAT